MSTSKDNTFSTNEDLKGRSPLKQTSTLLFENELERSLEIEPNSEQDIAAVSLSIDSLDTKIPTLTPQPPTSSKDETSEAGLKQSQLHYLEANKALTSQAIADADTAAKILHEAKATQLTILESLEDNKEDSIECRKNIEDLEAGLGKCQKILRESRFIQNEIEKLYNKTAKQTALDPSKHTTEVARLMTELHKAQKNLESMRDNTSQNQTESRKTLQEIHKELEACHNTRQQMEANKDLISSEVEASRALIEAMTLDALALIKNSEENLSTSKTGQTSYIALSREITALRQELKAHKRNTTHLSVDIESANKAIALNKTAVEAITNDLLNIKQTIRVTKRPSTVTNVTATEDRSEVIKLLEEAQTTHKRINQLLELNNTVSERISKVDKAIIENAQKQDDLTDQQQEALKGIQDQRKACRKLIEQANRSHILIVSACKKTSQLADTIDETTLEEKKHRNAILSALKDHRSQKKSLQTLQSSLERTYERQIMSLSNLEEAHQLLIQDEQKNQHLLEGLESKTLEINALTPQMQAQKNQADELLVVLAQTIENNNKTNQALQALQSRMADSFSAHKTEQQQLQDTISQQMQDYKITTEGLKNQQNRLEVLEQDFSNHMVNIDGLSKSIQLKIGDLVTQQASNEAQSKDLDYSKTELRYLKEQCDQLLKECISQSRISKINEETASKSIETLSKLEVKVSESLEHQKSQEFGLDQLNTLVNTALNELNAKLDQFQHIQSKAQEHNKVTGQLQQELVEITSNQKQSQQDISSGLTTMSAHIESASELRNHLKSLKKTLDHQAQEQTSKIEHQNEKLREQNAVLTAQSSLLEDVKSTFDQTQISLATIEQIRKKAQQSFAHLGAQKTKFETAFTQSFEKMKQQDQRQEKQEALLKETKAAIQQLNETTDKADAFGKWQDEVAQEISTKLQHIDEYQSRAFQAQQSALAKESQLDEQYQEFQQHLSHLQKMMESLDSTRLEEAQYRDELRALVHHHEQQQQQVENTLSESQDRHESLSRSLEDAHLMFRENKLATKETQMANRETKLILQEIRKEISSVKQAGWQTSSGREQWEGEERIEALETQLNRPLPENTPHGTDIDSKKKPYQPSSFML